MSVVEVTPGWTLVFIGTEGSAASLDGLDPWKLKWHQVRDFTITVAHPAYPHQRHVMSVHEIRCEVRTVRFAAGEFSNGVWGLYLPAH